MPAMAASRPIMFLLSAFCVLALAGAALASEETESSLPFEDSPAVEMPMLVAPVTVNGRLHYYAYMRIRLDAASTGQAWEVREKVAYLQDAFLREVHRESIVRNGDPKVIDGEGLRRRLLAVCERVLGPGLVSDVVFLDTAEQGAGTAPAETAPAPSAHAEH
jgi:hypothetical protein